MQHQPKKGSGTLFQNPALEVLTKAPAWIAYTYYLGVAIALLIVNVVVYPLEIEKVALLFVSGVLSFSLIEYLAHRFGYHFDAKSDRSKKFIYTIHGIHHDYPTDKERLIMPPVPWTVLASFLLGVFYLFFQLNCFAYMSGIIIGYLSYIYVHFQVHVPDTPRFIRGMKKHHNYHHYKNETLAFGVSSTLWDHVFGTMPPKKSV